MGAGGAYHGGSSVSGPSWDEMSPEQKEAYLEQQRQAKIRAEEYAAAEHRRKVGWGIFFGIVALIVIAIIIALACNPEIQKAAKEGWEEGWSAGQHYWDSSSGK